ncbi:hypothetical protein B0I35DRAFT_484748 [Stachybotrys elegans]|uniref:Uncharacterized protein n=1 Tax=Stachybotrys elegans TaxID=80388 RepID=A0A8K0SC30_9HYPO|nr:hypothetical protein B0I35DRAFT_484748 [Stachybotrys elegans]
MSVEPFGFALRKNGSCEEQEVDCGRTVQPYRACCPELSFCPASYNVDCCPDRSNCTVALLEEPKCANSTWDLYDNGGYFCCLPGLRGYATTQNSNGCAPAGYQFSEGETLLALISAGQDPSVSTTSPPETSSTATSTSPAATSTEPPPEEPSSSNNTGAIAGGVVGGVAVLAIAGVAAWFLLKRKRRYQGRKLAPGEPDGTELYEAGGEPRALGELPGKPAMPNELAGDVRPSELPAQTRPHELPG